MRPEARSTVAHWPQPRSCVMLPLAFDHAGGHVASEDAAAADPPHDLLVGEHPGQIVEIARLELSQREAFRLEGHRGAA